MATLNDVSFRFEFYEDEDHQDTPYLSIFADTEKIGACELLPLDATYGLEELVSTLRNMAARCKHLQDGGTLKSFAASSVSLKEGQQ
ncbi:hypothetical protein LRS03_01085 [Rhizobacter sp. J219]|uniref:hypothetical protein n=1 Tax=Rhizobacter sp. J219 TaxID=2898430 RepID=UPI0021514FE1|nr:hypothetical protein [Rhizobacter sp. J219]MCR5881535.1 hypothetical protein [Rhizobacter sp. J219]